VPYARAGFAGGMFYAESPFDDRSTPTRPTYTLDLSFSAVSQGQRQAEALMHPGRNRFFIFLKETYFKRESQRQAHAKSLVQPGRNFFYSFLKRDLFQKRVTMTSPGRISRAPW
jgi:hypothetical protein